MRRKESREKWAQLIMDQRSIKKSKANLNFSRRHRIIKIDKVMKVSPNHQAQIKELKETSM
jgi:hypothetical protein